MAAVSSRRLGRGRWKIGIVFVVICVVVGLLVGWAVTEASGAEAAPALTAERPICHGEDMPCPSSRVRTTREGVRKYHAGRLGRASTNIRYTKQQKRLILNKLQRVQRRQARAHRLTTLRPMTRAQLWHNFTRNDTCAYTWKPYSGTGTWAVWTCGAQTPIPRADFTPREVRGYICGGITGIGLGGALAAGAAGPWVWAGLGAGWAACMWQDQLERAARG
jgi:hypothetical protein